MEKKTKGKALVWVLTVTLMLAVVLGGVYLIGGGYLDEAVEKVSGWRENGTLEGVEDFIKNKLPPILIAAGAAIGTVLAALLPVIAKVKKAAEQIDTGTAESVKTTELAAEAREEMQAHNAATEERMRAFIEEQRGVFQEMMAELRADTAAERDKTARMEDGIRKLISMELIAHGASEELVKKGAASEIARVAEKTREEA